MSDSQVEYGLTASYGSQSPLNPTLVTDHVVTLMGLQAGADYHYRVKSRDAAGRLVVSGDLIFRIGGASSTGPQPVVWTQLFQVAANGSTLTKVAGCDGCQATAISQQSIAGGDGYVQFVAAEANRERWIGLMRSGKTAEARNLDYSFRLGTVGITSIRENGVYRWETTYKVGDVLRIAIENGVVRYYKNNALVYQSGVAATYPLVAAASIVNLGGTVSNAVISTSSSNVSLNVISNVDSLAFVARPARRRLNIQTQSLRRRRLEDWRLLASASLSFR
jgi:hypothetical protein